MLYSEDSSQPTVQQIHVHVSSVVSMLCSCDQLTAYAGHRATSSQHDVQL